jgi:hypothetical protein
VQLSRLLERDGEEKKRRNRKMSSECLFLIHCITHYTICTEVPGRSPMDIVDEGTHIFPDSTSYCISLHTPMAYVIYWSAFYWQRSLFEQNGCTTEREYREVCWRSQGEKYFETVYNMYVVQKVKAVWWLKENKWIKLNFILHHYCRP